MTYATPVREADGWRIALEDGTVTQVQIDFALGLIVSLTPNEGLFIRIETAFGFGTSDKLDRVKWDHPAQLGRFAELHGVTIREIKVTDTGILTISFKDGRLIQAEPDVNYEAYQVGSQRGVSEDGWLLVALPGGGVSAWLK